MGAQLDLRYYRVCVYSVCSRGFVAHWVGAWDFSVGKINGEEMGGI